MPQDIFDRVEAKVNNRPLPQAASGDVFDRVDAKLKGTDFPLQPKPLSDFMSAPMRFLSGAAEILDPSQLITAVQHPIDTFRGLFNAPMVQFAKSAEAAKQGRYSEATGHGLAAVTPIVGPAAADIGEELGNSGDLATALGKTAALVGPSLYENVGSLPKFKLKTFLNPKEAAAVEFADKSEIPVSLATRTNNPAVGAAEAATKYLPGSASKAAALRQGIEEGLQTTGDQLAASIPGTVSKENAGLNVRSALQGKVEGLNQLADVAYAEARQIANDPANVKRVQVGTEPKVMLENGGVVTKTVPVMQDIASPVDIKSVKVGLAPLLEELEKQIPVAQREMSPGLTALKNVMSGPDVVPLSQALGDLSSIQNVSRADIPALRSRSQGIAAVVVKPFRQAVDQTAADVGALDALNRGRDLIKQKYGVSDMLDAVNNREPVRIVDSLTSRDDTGIQALKQIQLTTPQVVPDLARSTLEGIMEKATNEGGFKGKGAFAQWNRIGDETKRILFGGQAGDLDNFFQYAKMAEKDLNPSGTAKVGALIGTGELLIHDPIRGAGVLLGARQLSKLLYSPDGAKLVTTGLSLPLTNPKAAFFAKAILAKAGVDQGQQTASGGQ
jgi:hypothetical protein